ncbi:MAG: methylenetetrahydrofolate reductase, partial [Bacteroidia bacterium]|nr:methylenetetrahydrofolate reductase [Bacteroidia bacterium]
LVKQVKQMNHGKYMIDDLVDVTPTNFCIGVAGYPEKHFEAPNMVSDLRHLKAKIDAGAEYIVTQMFFDNAQYFDFVKKCREMDIHVPIIPGLKILTTKRQATILPKIFKIDIPQDMLEQIEKCKTDAEVKEVGIEWCIQQSKQLVKEKVPCLHYYTMGTSETTRRVASQVF